MRTKPLNETINEHPPTLERKTVLGLNKVENGVGGRAKLGPRALVLHVRTRALSIRTPLVVDVDRRAMGVPTTGVTRWKTTVPV
jgi:hypothetical protein